MKCKFQSIKYKDEIIYWYITERDRYVITL